ncbi:MAG: prolipoprotein diacylglyceryl transferase [Parachlamydiaceae bacterium]|nr:prolipoprotein diacylglyceryl transferase [Parachlamydiaceae bacterium]
MHPQAWLYWNPERVVFTIPLINRPVVWYGLWFVFGFLVGYFILIPMFQRKIQDQGNQLRERDVENWPELMRLLKQNPPLLQSLNKVGRQLITQINGTPSASEKTTILNALNQAGLDRQQLKVLYPKMIYSSRNLAALLVDRLTWFVVAGTIIGARLGHVFFYDWPRYAAHPEDIVKVWEGGLASHGGALGVMIGLYLYQRTIRNQFPDLTFLSLMDMIVIPTAFVAGCIRIGNFFNQEILGFPSSLPWAVIFGDPIDGGEIVPRHPVQLYEAISYFGIFFILLYLWRKPNLSTRTGLFSGLFFILAFSSRFVLETLKVPQSMMWNESWLQTGQYLSLPFIFLGIALCIYAFRSKFILQEKR